MEKKIEEQLSELPRELCELALKDESIREEIIKDPRGFIERHWNVKLPEHLKIRIIDQDERDVLYIPLPPHITKIVGKELGEQELEKVAGGIMGGTQAPYAGIPMSPAGPLMGQQTGFSLPQGTVYKIPKSQMGRIGMVLGPFDKIEWV